jgi:hypothetical protein
LWIRIRIVIAGREPDPVALKSTKKLSIFL